jgi:hypothetical protein
MASLLGKDMQFTWTGGAGGDATIAVAKIVRGQVIQRRPVHDDSPINTDDTSFIAGTSSTHGWMDLHVDSAAPGLPPTSGLTGTLTIFRNKGGTSTNKIAGTAFLYGLDNQWVSLGGAPIQVARYYFHFTGAITATDPT